VSERDAISIEDVDLYSNKKTKKKFLLFFNSQKKGRKKERKVYFILRITKYFCLFIVYRKEKRSSTYMYNEIANIHLEDIRKKHFVFLLFFFLIYEINISRHLCFKRENQFCDTYFLPHSLDF